MNTVYKKSSPSSRGLAGRCPCPWEAKAWPSCPYHRPALSGPLSVHWGRSQPSSLAGLLRINRRSRWRGSSLPVEGQKWCLRFLTAKDLIKTGPRAPSPRLILAVPLHPPCAPCQHCCLRALALAVPGPPGQLSRGSCPLTPSPLGLARVTPTHTSHGGHPQSVPPLSAPPLPPRRARL